MSIGDRCLGGLSLRTTIMIIGLVTSIVVASTGAFTAYVDAQLEPIKQTAEANKAELQDRKRAVYQTEQSVIDIKNRLDRLEDKIDLLLSK